jgi:hypothetical protein
VNRNIRTIMRVLLPTERSSSAQRRTTRHRRRQTSGILAPHASTGMSRFLHSRSAALGPSAMVPLCSQKAGPCPRAVIEPGTASGGIRGKLSFVGALWVPPVAKRELAEQTISVKRVVSPTRRPRISRGWLCLASDLSIRHRPHHQGGRPPRNRLTVSGVPSQGDGQGESPRSNLDAFALCLDVLHPRSTRHRAHHSVQTGQTPMRSRQRTFSPRHQTLLT